MHSCTSRSDVRLFVVLALDLFVGLLLLCLFFRLLYLVRDDPVELRSTRSRLALVVVGFLPLEVLTRTAAVWQLSNCNLLTHEVLVGIGGALTASAAFGLYSLERVILRDSFHGTKYNVPTRTIRVLDVGFATAVFLWLLCAISQATHKEDGSKVMIAASVLNTMAFIALLSVFCKIIFEFSGRLIELVAAQRRFADSRQRDANSKLNACNQAEVQPKAAEDTPEINVVNLSLALTGGTSASAGATLEPTTLVMVMEIGVSNDTDSDDVNEDTTDDESDFSYCTEVSDAKEAADMCVCVGSECIGDDGGVKCLGDDDSHGKKNCTNIDEKTKDDDVMTERIQSLEAVSGSGEKNTASTLSLSKLMLPGIGQHSAALSRFGEVHREFLIVAAKQMLLSMYTAIAVLCGFIGITLIVFCRAKSVGAVIGTLLYDLDFLIIATRVCLNHQLFAAEYKLMCGESDLFCRRLASYRTRVPADDGLLS